MKEGTEGERRRKKKTEEERRRTIKKEEYIIQERHEERRKKEQIRGRTIREKNYKYRKKGTEYENNRKMKEEGKNRTWCTMSCLLLFLANIPSVIMPDYPAFVCIFRRVALGNCACAIWQLSLETEMCHGGLGGPDQYTCLF
jgi:hypothetical protein